MKVDIKLDKVQVMQPPQDLIDQVEQNTDDIAELKTNVGEINENIEHNHDDIVDLQTKTIQNSDNIILLKQNVESNSTNISANSANISALDTRIARLEDQPSIPQDLIDQVEQNTDDIAELKTNVGEITTKIIEQDNHLDRLDKKISDFQSSIPDLSDVSDDILPSQNSQINLGSEENKWNNVYAINLFQGQNKVLDTSSNIASDKINSLMGYEKASSSLDISASDTLNQALGKLEYKVDNVQGSSGMTNEEKLKIINSSKIDILPDFSQTIIKDGKEYWGDFEVVMCNGEKCLRIVSDQEYSTPKFSLRNVIDKAIAISIEIDTDSSSGINDPEITAYLTGYNWSMSTVAQDFTTYIANENRNTPFLNLIYESTGLNLLPFYTTGNGVYDYWFNGIMIIHSNDESKANSQNILKTLSNRLIRNLPGNISQNYPISYRNMDSTNSWGEDKNVCECKFTFTFSFDFNLPIRCFSIFSMADLNTEYRLLNYNNALVQKNKENKTFSPNNNEFGENIFPSFVPNYKDEPYDSGLLNYQYSTFYKTQNNTLRKDYAGVNYTSVTTGCFKINPNDILYFELVVSKSDSYDNLNLFIKCSGLTKYTGNNAETISQYEDYGLYLLKDLTDYNLNNYSIKFILCGSSITPAKYPILYEKLKNNLNIQFTELFVVNSIASEDDNMTYFTNVARLVFGNTESVGSTHYIEIKKLYATNINHLINLEILEMNLNSGSTTVDLTNVENNIIPSTNESVSIGNENKQFLNVHSQNLYQDGNKVLDTNSVGVGESDIQNMLDTVFAL